MGYPMRGFRPETMRYLFREIFLADEYTFPATVPDPVIVDCGANIGFSVLTSDACIRVRESWRSRPTPVRL
jgi:hypothetical protein